MDCVCGEMKSRNKQRHVYDYYIDEHGRWFCEGNPVTDRQLFRLLSCSLHERSGRFFVRCEGEVHPVRVADAPLWIRYIHPRIDAARRLIEVELELEDGRRELLDPDTLTVFREQALYCRATRRRMKARFGKVAYYELARYIRFDVQTGNYYLEVAGKRFFIHRERDGVSNSCPTDP